MTFAAKYEILEAVARGAVETFVARKMATDEPVLVHIFECQEQPANQPTVQWVLESFRMVAPDPCGLVVETGRYEATSYGYLVTRLPEKYALQSWIQAYNARQVEAGVVAPPPGAAATDSQESTKPVTNGLSESEETTRVLGFDRPEEITNELEALGPELEPSSAANQSPSAAPGDQAHPDASSGEFREFGLEVPAAVQPNVPGDFTQPFFPDLGDEQGNATAHLSGVPPGQEPCEPTNRFSAAGTEDREATAADCAPETPSGTFPKTVLRSTDSIKSTGPDSSPHSASLPQPVPIPSSASGKTADLSTVTSFFPGPFDGQRSAETPDLSRAVASEEKETGDFTRLFGSPNVDSSAHLAGTPGAKRPAVASDPGSFTRLFESIEALKKTSSEYKANGPSEDDTDATYGVLFTAKGQPSPAPVSGSAKMPVDSLPPPTSSRDRAASSGSDLPVSSRSEPEAATRVFSGRESVSSLSALPAGPSEYTRIISGGLKKPGASGERPDTAGPPGSAGSATLPPTATSPQFPPAGGQPQVPAPPQIPVLPVTQHPPLATAAPKTAGPPWTMIIILNGLFIIAVLLVLYFVFQH